MTIHKYGAPRGIVFALVIAIAGTAAAQQASTRSQPLVPYVSAGVGEEQQQWIAQHANEGYTLKLLFVEKGTGAYVADVRVRVTDSAGRMVLDALASGPAFLARLPEGDYRVTLDYRGEQQSRTVHASPRSGTTAVYWAADDARNGDALRDRPSAPR